MQDGRGEPSEVHDLGEPGARMAQAVGLGVAGFMVGGSASFGAVYALASLLGPTFGLIAALVSGAAGGWLAASRLVRRLALPSVRLGSTSLTILRGSRTRAIDYADLLAVEAEHERIAIHLVDGTTERLTTRTAQGGDEGDPVQALKVVDEIRKAMPKRRRHQGGGRARVHITFELGRPSLRNLQFYAVGVIVFVLAAMLLLPLLVGVLFWAHLPPWLLTFAVLPSFLAARGAALHFEMPTVRVGSDGVAVRRRGREEFWPYSTITSVAVEGTSIVVERASGKDRLKTQSGQGGDGGDAGQAGDVVRAMRTALEQWSASSGAGTVRAHVERRGRPFAEWRADLAALLSSGSDYREAAIGRDDLIGVLEDASASAEERIGAAIALRSPTNEAAPVDVARIRVAASASANERVRIALDHVADDEIEEEAIEEALRA